MTNPPRIYDGPQLAHLAEVIAALTGCSIDDAWRGIRFCQACGVMRDAMNGYRAAVDELAKEGKNGQE